jgi:hypothetical protein
MTMEDLVGTVLNNIGILRAMSEAAADEDGNGKTNGLLRLNVCTGGYSPNTEDRSSDHRAANDVTHQHRHDQQAVVVLGEFDMMDNTEEEVSAEKGTEGGGEEKAKDGGAAMTGREDTDVTNSTGRLPPSPLHQQHSDSDSPKFVQLSSLPLEQEDGDDEEMADASETNDGEDRMDLDDNHQVFLTTHNFIVNLGGEQEDDALSTTEEAIPRETCVSNDTVAPASDVDRRQRSQTEAASTDDQSDARPVLSAVLPLAISQASVDGNCAGAAVKVAQDQCCLLNEAGGDQVQTAATTGEEERFQNGPGNGDGAKNAEDGQGEERDNDVVVPTRVLNNTQSSNSTTVAMNLLNQLAILDALGRSCDLSTILESNPIAAAAAAVAFHIQQQQQVHAAQPSSGAGLGLGLAIGSSSNGPSSPTARGAVEHVSGEYGSAGDQVFAAQQQALHSDRDDSGSGNNSANHCNRASSFPTAALFSPYGLISDKVRPAFERTVQYYVSYVFSLME